MLGVTGIPNGDSLAANFLDAMRVLGFRSGTVDLSAGDIQKTVLFSSAVTGDIEDFALVVFLVNYDDLTPQRQILTAVDKALAGFTADLSSKLVTANSKVEYVLFPHI